MKKLHTKYVNSFLYFILAKSSRVFGKYILLFSINIYLFILNSDRIIQVCPFKRQYLSYYRN